MTGLCDSDVVQFTYLRELAATISSPEKRADKMCWIINHTARRSCRILLIRVCGCAEVAELMNLYDSAVLTS